MRRLVLLFSVLLLGACWAAAQDTTPSNSSKSDPTSASSGQSDSASASGATSVQGCLSGSSGNYTLTDKNGNTQELWGEANKLGRLVGHKVELTGTPSIKTTDSTMQGIASSAREQHVYRVKTVKDLSKTCTQ